MSAFQKKRQPVSVIIPNYNGAALLKKNLLSVFQCLEKTDEIIIIDDASTDTSVSYLHKKYQLKKIGESSKTIKYSSQNSKIRLYLLVNSNNIRFGASVNKAVKYAHHKYVFLLNTDVSPHKDVLIDLFNAFDEETFAVAPKEYEQILHSENDLQVFGGKNELWFEKGIFFTKRADTFESGETAWVSGGSGLFQRKKWLELKGFDSRFYPAYWEDIDLSFRARKKGWKILFASDAIVDHNHETTNNSVFGSRKIMKMSWKNADIFTKKNASFFQKILYIIWRPYWWYKRQILLWKKSS